MKKKNRNEPRLLQDWVRPVEAAAEVGHRWKLDPLTSGWDVVFRVLASAAEKKP